MVITVFCYYNKEKTRNIYKRFLLLNEIVIFLSLLYTIIDIDIYIYTRIYLSYK